MAVQSVVSKRRSTITRGKSLYPVNTEIDQRGAAPRRFKDLVEEFTDAAFAAHKGLLTASGKIVARRCASLTVQCEAMEQEYLEGNVEDLCEHAREYARLCGTLSRLLTKLGIALVSKPHKSDESLEGYTARVYGRKDDDDDEEDD